MILQTKAEHQNAALVLEAIKNVFLHQSITAKDLNCLEPYHKLVKAVNSFEDNGKLSCLCELLLPENDMALLLWCAGKSEREKDQALEKFIFQPNLKQVDIEANGLKMRTIKGERVQLRYDFKEQNVEEIGLHILLKTKFDVEPFAALRWLTKEGSEQVMVRLRSSSFIMAQQIEHLAVHHNQHQLLSLLRHRGMDIILLNGVPVVWQHCQHSQLRGVVLDLIGNDTGSCEISLPFVLISNKAYAPNLSSENTAALLSSIVENCADTENFKDCSTWLHALSGISQSLETEPALKMLKATLDKPKAYQDYIERKLLAKIAPEALPMAQKLLLARPTPTMRVEKVTVKIDANPSKHASLRYLFFSRPEKVILLDGIDFEAFHGDIIGIIGKNGAGKSTFLKTLVTAMPMSEGKIICEGRPLLLRPGAGMQGDLTGRENIIKTGLYMGFLPHEMRLLMDDIISFSELEGHIDRPFRYYSDGMRARLIFALATAIPRDVLLFDELLSAGDVGFQLKAMERLDGFIRKAKLVFVVQHTFDFVLSRCTKCLLLNHGRLIYFGDPRVATELYKEMC